MPRLKLDDVLDDDDLLGEVKLSGATASTEDERVLQSFEEINLFIDRHGHKPGDSDKTSVSHTSVSERGLQMRLAGLLDKPDMCDLLRPQDRHSLLPPVDIAPKSLDDVLDDDDLLGADSDDIFDLVHVKPPAARPDKISERQHCKDFEQFKPLFDCCASEIRDGKRKAIKFANESEISAGEFFILNGIMVYVAQVGETQIRNGKKNARLRLIFDNGTEGNNLLRSLATELYKDPNGRRITSPDAGPLFDEQPQEGDLQTGMIYVLKSLSDDPEIRKLDGLLHKIGFTSGKMEVRIQNAHEDPTFLMAPVHPVATYTLYNINKVKLEHLLHNFFADARLDIEITDRFGKKVRPREWFLVKPEVIAEAITRLKDGTIIDCRYDVGRSEIIPIS